MVRVLVTGSSGFVGYWMIAHLRACGDEVLTFPDDLDIRDRAGLDGAVAALVPEGIIHLAAQASVGSSWSDATTTFDTNAMGTLHLLEAARAAVPGSRVLLISSAEVYGLVGAADLPIGEDRPFAPVSPYAASKAAAELLGVQFFLGRGLEVVRARPFGHTGVGQRPDFVVPSLARQVVEVVRLGRRQLQTGNLEARRDVTDVRDVVRAYRVLLDRGEPGSVYNVCRGTSVAIDDIARRLLALAEVDVPLMVDPARVRPVDQPDLRGDPSRLHAATGWVPDIELDQTLTDVLAHWAMAEEPPT